LGKVDQKKSEQRAQSLSQELGIELV